MQRPQPARVLAPGVHRWPDEVSRDTVVYCLVLDDGSREMRRVPAEMADDWMDEHARNELAAYNARYCPAARRPRLKILA